jgi:hypothetical protein
MDSYKVFYVQRLFRRHPHHFVRLTQAQATLPTVSSINIMSRRFETLRGGWYSQAVSPLLSGCEHHFTFVNLRQGRMKNEE